MSDRRPQNEMGGGVPGFQLPVGSQDEDVSEEVRLPEHTEAAVRALVRQKLAEVIKKKGNSYVLYAPNKGKRKKAHRVGSFPTRAQAEEAQDRQKKSSKKSSKTEGLNVPTMEQVVESASRELMHSGILAEAVKRDLRRSLSEATLETDGSGSEWDEFIDKLSDRVISGDKTFQRRERAIQKASEIMIQTAARQVARSLRGVAKVKDLGLKTDGEGNIFTALSIDLDQAAIEPIMIGVHDGRLQVSFGDGAKAALTKIDPEHARAIRGELAALQDAAVGNEAIDAAIAKRDRYLQRMEAQVDQMIAGLNPMQIAMLKRLLVQKYRKLS